MGEISENGDYATSPEAAKARENAWRVLAHLITFAEHVKEADLYWKLAENAIEKGESQKEQQRVMTIAETELRNGRLAKDNLEALLKECLAAEAGDEAEVTPDSC